MGGLLDSGVAGHDSVRSVVGFFGRIIELFKLGLFLSGVGWIVYNVIAWRTSAYYVTNRWVLSRDGLIRQRSTNTLLASVGDVRG